MSVRDSRPEFAEVPIQLIDEPELPARSRMDDEKMEELTTSIRANGVLVPISIVRVGERFEVIAGHRRRIAAGRAGVPVMRALIYPEKTAALEAIKHAENRFREEMSAAEEAAYFTELLHRDCGGDTNRLAELVGERRSYVENRLLLMLGAPEVLAALEEKKIGIGVAHELNKCGEKLMRDYFLDIAIRDGATQGTVVGWVQQWKAGLGPGGIPAAPAAPASAPSVAPAMDYFRCYICGKNHNVHTMQPINVHASCREAILDPLLGKDVGTPSTSD